MVMLCLYRIPYRQILESTERSIIMKKIISAVLSMIVLAGVCVFPTHANSAVEAAGEDMESVPRGYKMYPQYVNESVLTRERTLYEENNNRVLDVEDYIYLCCFLDEKYYHYNENGEMDWLFFSCRSYRADSWDNQGIFYGRLICMGDTCAPFWYECGIYDLEEEVFYSIDKAYIKEKFADIDDALSCTKYGQYIGDVTHDNVIDIRDATLIQKVLAKIVNINPDDVWVSIANDFDRGKRYKFKGIYDMNRDMQIDVDDVTALQKSIAGLDYLS